MEAFKASAHGIALGSVVLHKARGEQNPEDETTCRARAGSRVESLVSDFMDGVRQPTADACQAMDERDESVFCNNPLALQDISVIGFDYDYTLVSYTHEVQHLIYDKARDYLLSHAGYPSRLKSMSYDENFAIRGLLFDKKTGMLLKLSVSQRVSSAFIGRREVEHDELLRAYGGTLHVSTAYMKRNMVWVNDLFSLSEACLLADVVQLAIDSSIPFEPYLLQEDVKNAINYVHKSGVMHETIAGALQSTSIRIRSSLRSSRRTARLERSCFSSRTRHISSLMQAVNFCSETNGRNFLTSS